MAYLEDRGVTGPWDSCLEKLARDELRPASVQDIVRKRVATDRKACVEGSWTAENFNYLPGGRILIASRESNPLIPNAREARLAHEHHREYVLPPAEAERLQRQAEEDRDKPPEERRVFRMTRNESYAVTISSLADDDLMRFLARDDLPAYRDLLKDQGCKAMRIQVLDMTYRLKQREPFAKAMWFDDLVSGLVGNTDLTHYHPGRCYGVPKG